jgi:hypothetical protein
MQKLNIVILNKLQNEGTNIKNSISYISKDLVSTKKWGSNAYNLQCNQNLINQNQILQYCIIYWNKKSNTIVHKVSKLFQKET